MSTKYIRQPIEVQALKIPEKLPKEWPDWFQHGLNTFSRGLSIHGNDIYVENRSLEPEIASSGDYIVLIGNVFRVESAVDFERQHWTVLV